MSKVTEIRNPAAVAWEVDNVQVCWSRGTYRLMLGIKSADGTWLNTPISAPAYELPTNTLAAARAVARRFIADAVAE